MFVKPLPRVVAADPGSMETPADERDDRQRRRLAAPLGISLAGVALGVVGVAAALYVTGLSAVRWWTIGLRERGVADVRAARAASSI